MNISVPLSSQNTNSISAVLSPEIRHLMENYTFKNDLQEIRFIETALLHHIQALRDLPDDIVVPPRIVVSKQTGEKIKALLDNPPDPEPALKALYESD